MATYLKLIGKREDTKCWWCWHEYQTGDHLFKWCERWKQEQKDFRKKVEKEMMQKKIQIPMSLVFMKECMQALLDFLCSTNVGSQWTRGGGGEVRE
jgi:hypothetical protein